MKHVSRRIAALVALSTVCALTACEVDTPFSRPAAMANGVGVVVGSSAHEPRLTAEQWEAEIVEHVGDGTTLTLVSADGEAEVLATWRVALPANASEARHDLEDQVDRLSRGAAATTATAAEVDPWGALAAARRALGEVAECTLFTSSSFLSTVLPIDLPRLGLGVEVTDLATQLVEAGALPDLTGCTVVALALGETAGQQAALDEQGRASLASLVVTLLELAGAEVDLSQTLRGEAPGDGLPPVTAVPVVPFVPSAAAVPAPSQPCRAEIPESVVRFIADQAVFVEPEAAAATIASAAEALRGCDLSALTVYATTSSAGDAASRLALSEQRGRAFAEPLATALGIDPATINVVGLGACEGPAAGASPVSCVDDRPNGELDLDLAQLNRRAVVVAEPLAG